MLSLKLGPVSASSFPPSPIPVPLSPAFHASSKDSLPFHSVLLPQHSAVLFQDGKVHFLSAGLFPLALGFVKAVSSEETFSVGAPSPL